MLPYTDVLQGNVAKAGQKWKEGYRWDRVDGRIESLIQGRVRSRGRGDY